MQQREVKLIQAYEKRQAGGLDVVTVSDSQPMKSEYVLLSAVFI